MLNILINISRTVVLAAVLLLVSAQTMHAQQTDDAVRVAERLQQRYESLVSMRARFVHTMTSDFLDVRDRYSGTLVFEDEKYRVETLTQTIVTDGEVTWVFNRGENQVLINDYDADESTFSLTEILKSFDDDYEALAVEEDELNETQHRVLTLEPRDALADYRSVRLWIRDADGLVTHMRLIDLNDAVLEFDLSEIQFNPPVDDATFTFDVPEGVDVVDLRN